MTRKPYLWLFPVLLFIAHDRFSASVSTTAFAPFIQFATTSRSDTLPPGSYTIVPRDIRMKQYFRYIQETAQACDTLVPEELREHLLVRANPWLLDTLANTDYDRRLWLYGDTLLNQPNCVVLRQGDTLLIPDSALTVELLHRLRNTLIDVNIPEFTMRIVEGGDTLYTFPVRVGKNKKRYLATAGRVVDLRTQTGNGTVVRINRDPLFRNPVTGKKFTHTHRDDGVLTLMPLIPWVEVELGGMRYGQMIHPTTNPETLGKAYSNGCIGLGEADSWRFYYHAPLGTAVQVRYDLVVKAPNGDTLVLPDVYGWAARAKRKTK